MGKIEDALTAIDALGPGEKIVYSKFAAEFGVATSTLIRRHQGASTSANTKALNQQNLHPHQEEELIKYISQLTQRGLPPTRAMIRNFGSQIARKAIGKCWVDRFVKRHSIDLISRYAVGIDNNRHKADSPAKYKLYFSLLDDKIKKYEIEPNQIYNMDEKGFLLGVIGKEKRIFSRRFYYEGNYRSIIQDGNREWISLLACICADGSALEPALIYQSDACTLQDTWLQGFNPEEDRAHFTSSTSGWTNNDIGLAWLKQVFERNTKSKGRSKYRLLIVDGHGSHITMDFIEYCDQNKILLAIYPPHSTHSLQPLDVGMFRPLASAYSQQISRFMEDSQGLVSISKRDFYPFFKAAWAASFYKESILSSFRATGLSPFNPEVILKRFNNQPIQEHISDSESSQLSGSNWRELENLVRQVVKNRDDKGAKKLSRIFHHITTKKSILEHEVLTIRRALIHERERRKPGKVLPLQQDEDYHGGAVFWSPRKVKEARDRQVIRAEEEQQRQHQKLEARQDRDRQRQIKAIELKSRRAARAEARLSRQNEKAAHAADQAARQAARKAAKRLQQAIQSSKKGKRPSLKPLIKACYNKKAAQKGCGGEKPSGAAQGLPPVQSRRGRKIKLPIKYR